MLTRTPVHARTYIQEGAGPIRKGEGEGGRVVPLVVLLTPSQFWFT